MTLMDDAATTLRRYRETSIIVDSQGLPIGEVYALVLARLICQQTGLREGYALPVARDLIQQVNLRTLTMVPEDEQVVECVHPGCERLGTLHGDQGWVCLDHMEWIRPQRPCRCAELTGVEAPDPGVYGHHPDCPHWVVPPHDIEELFR